MIDQITIGAPKKSGFDMSNYTKGTGKLGRIIPTRVMELMPSDRIKGSTQASVQFEPLAVPILANMYVKQESFVVPMRLVWSRFERFITGKKNDESSLPVTNIYSILTSYRELYYFPDSISFLSLFLSETFGTIKRDLDSWLLGVRSNSMLNQFAIADTLYYQCKRFYDDVKNIYDSGEKTVERWSLAFWDLFSPIVGPGSMLDYMNAPIAQYSAFYESFRFFFGDVTTGDGMSWDVFFAPYSGMCDYNFFNSLPFNWLPFRAAYLVWYWNYRDQLLESDALDPEDYRADSVSEYEQVVMTVLRPRCWSKDTFTTALQNTGSGNLVVPISGNVISSSYSDDSTSGVPDTDLINNDGSLIRKIHVAGTDYLIPTNYLSGVEGSGRSFSESGFGIDLLRRVQRLARWLQKNLILGWEYADVLYSHFMVKSSDARLQLPEIIDSSRQLVQINTIVNNTTTAEDVAGSKSATAGVYDHGNGFNYFSEEHAYLLSFMSVMPEQSYCYGVDRLYLRRERFDFAWPEFAQLGMDAIYNVELKVPTSEEHIGESLKVFGYQGRYYDYKSRKDEEHGRLLTDLNMYTFSRDFDYSAEHKMPKLNYWFVHCWPSLDMFVVEDENEDVFRYDVHHSLAAERPLPVAGTEMA